MKFKKIFATVCSFLLAASSFMAGGSASARYVNFEKHSYLRGSHILCGGKYSKDPNDSYVKCKNEYASIYDYNEKFFEPCGALTFDQDCGFHNLLWLHNNYEDPAKANHSLYGFGVPDALTFIVNLSETEKQVKQDLHNALVQIRETAKNTDTIFQGDDFKPGGALKGQEVDITKLHTNFVGMVPDNFEQKTSDEGLLSILDELRTALNLAADDFDNFQNVFVLKDGTFTNVTKNEPCNNFIANLVKQMEDTERIQAARESWLEITIKRKQMRNKQISIGCGCGIGGLAIIGGGIYGVLNNRAQHKKQIKPAKLKCAKFKQKPQQKLKNKHSPQNLRGNFYIIFNRYATVHLPS